MSKQAYKMLIITCYLIETSVKLALNSFSLCSIKSDIYLLYYTPLIINKKLIKTIFLEQSLLLFHLII